MSGDDFLLKAGIIRVKGRCLCKDRQDAQRDGSFFYLPIHKGYAFADAAGGVRKKDYRPFLFVDCPWCGGTLVEDDE